MSAPWQAIREIAAELKAVTWDTSPNEEVLGSSVYITGGLEESRSLPGRLPFAFLNFGTATTDPDDPALVEQEVMLILAVAVGGHEYGEHALIGGPGAGSPRSSSSKGRGVGEVEVPILAAIGRLTGADGVPILVVDRSHTQTQFLEGKHIAWRQYVLAVTCTETEEFPPPSHFAFSSNTGSWDLPASRYDLDSIVLRYNNTGTAPTSVTDGSGITLAADLSTSVDVSGTTGSGTFSFALFAKYVAFGTDDPKYSSQVTGTTRLSVSVS